MTPQDPAQEFAEGVAEDVSYIRRLHTDSWFEAQIAILIASELRAGGWIKPVKITTQKLVDYSRRARASQSSLREWRNPPIPSPTKSM